MILIVGGLGQGKSAFAAQCQKEEISGGRPGRTAAVFNGRKEEPEQAFAAGMVLHLEAVILRLMREGEDAAPEAREILEDNGVAQSVTVTCSGDTRIITGETVAVEDPETGLTGIFWVDADTHTWQGGDYTLRLTLNCRNVMETGNSGSEVDE